jgi:hypothetical protein
MWNKCQNLFTCADFFVAFNIESHFFIDVKANHQQELMAFGDRLKS